MSMPPGYPDYQTYPQWRTGNVLPSTFPVLGAGVTLYAIQTIAHYRGIYLEIVPQAGFGTVSVDWYMDSAKTIHTGTDSWDVNSITGLRAHIPARGFYFTVSVNNQHAAGDTWETLCMLSNACSDKITYPLRHQDILQRLISCPANTNLNFSYAFIMPGPTSVHFTDNAASGKLSLFGYTSDPSGAQTSSMFFFQAPQTDIARDFQLTARPFVVQVQNSDAVAAHTFDLYVATPER